MRALEVKRKKCFKKEGMIVVPSAAELSNKRREGSMDFVGEGFSVTLA